jgi:hypothetical protein
MDNSPPVETQRRWTDPLRWACVLPAAYLASWLFGGIIVFLLSSLGVNLRGGAYPAFLFPLLQYLPSGIAFTFVGALVAPSRRIATATVLAAMCILISLMTHIFWQSNPGLTNYMHAMGESLGAVTGVAATFRRRMRFARLAD